MRRLAAGLVLAVVLVLALTYRPLLNSLGEFLVDSQTPEKADVAVVLAGDYRGNRVTMGGELVRKGLVPVALVSGPVEIYGMNEATLATRYAQEHGFPAKYFQPTYIQANSTLEEARAFAPILRGRNIRSVLLVTSNFHTRRAGETFRREIGPQVRFVTISAPDPHFDPSTWWHNREGQKTVFYELSKTLAGWVGL